MFPTQAETLALRRVEAASAGVPSVVNDLAVLREVLSVDGKAGGAVRRCADNAKLSAAVSKF